MVVNRYLSATSLIDNGNFHPITKRAFALNGKQINIFYHHIIFDYVVGNVIPDLVDKYIIAYPAVVNCCIADARRSRNAPRKRYILFKNA
ncbi:hypothetical protein ES703_105474 [subsurface metagenome]